jgi:TRAP-type mannitol/chloroaromatic compound transport system permease small subunit
MPATDPRTAASPQLDAGVEAASSAAQQRLTIDHLAAWALPLLALLLCAQWPLRDGVQAGSRLANDLAQCLFALICAVAVSSASRAGAHLAAHPLLPRWRARHVVLLSRVVLLLGVLPWSLFALWSSAGQVVRSLRQLEAFPDSYNPGYFVVKLAVWLLCGGMAWQGWRDLRGGIAAAGTHAAPAGADPAQRQS